MKPPVKLTAQSKMPNADWVDEFAWNTAPYSAGRVFRLRVELAQDTTPKQFHPAVNQSPPIPK
jgi:hypothetical protein